MGKLIVTEFVTLDGVAQAPGGPDEDRDGEFTHGGWQMQWENEAASAPEHPDADGVSPVYEQAKRMDALLLGRRTYDIFAGFWPTAPAESPFTALLNGVPKYVASYTLSDPLAWENSTVLTGGLAEAIGPLKERHDRIHVMGSLNLVQSLLRLGMVDRLNLWLYPVVLGSGKRVFADGTVPATLHLAESVATANGRLQLAYEFGAALTASQPAV